MKREDRTPFGYTLSSNSLLVVGDYIKSMKINRENRDRAAQWTTKKLRDEFIKKYKITDCQVIDDLHHMDWFFWKENDGIQMAVAILLRNKINESTNKPSR